MGACMPRFKKRQEDKNLVQPSPQNQMEEWFERAIREKKWFIVQKVKDEGSVRSLHRAVAEQVFGDQEMHLMVRRMCIHYIVKYSQYFSQYWTTPCLSDPDHKHTHDCHDKHPLILALADVFCCPVEIYHYDLTPKTVFPRRRHENAKPISISYHLNEYNSYHYKAVVDPDRDPLAISLDILTHRRKVFSDAEMADAPMMADEPMMVDAPMMLVNEQMKMYAQKIVDAETMIDPPPVSYDQLRIYAQMLTAAGMTKVTYEQMTVGAKKMADLGLLEGEDFDQSHTPEPEEMDGSTGSPSQAFLTVDDSGEEPQEMDGSTGSPSQASLTVDDSGEELEEMDGSTWSPSQASLTVDDSGDSPSTSAAYSYSYLPDDTLLTLLRLSSLEDRFSLSLVCHRLNKLFHHRSVWRSVTLSFYGFCFRPQSTADDFLPYNRLKRSHAWMAFFFGQYFEEVTLRVNGFSPVRLATSSLKMLEWLSNKWGSRLRSLRIETGTVPCPTPYFDQMVETEEDSMSILRKIILKSTNLTCLDILTWPSVEDFSSVSGGFLEDASFPRVRSLNLFHKFHDCYQSPTMIVRKPIPLPALLQRFPALSHLYVQVTMISRELLHCIAGSQGGQMETLSIVDSHMEFNPPRKLLAWKEITSEDWMVLSAVCPLLQVFFRFECRWNDSDLVRLLKPEIPVSGVTVFKYSLCSAQLLTLLLPYGRLLQSLSVFQAGPGCQYALLRLVVCCPHLRHLVYWGRLHVYTVVFLAFRSLQWRTFKIAERHIDTRPVGEVENGEKVFLIKNAECEVLLTTAKYRLKDVEHDIASELQRVSREVSQALGYAWRPFTDEDEFQSLRI